MINFHNKSWISLLIKNGKWYLLGSIATKAASFFMLPVYTRYLTTEDYGIINSVNAVSGIIVFMMSLSLDAALARYYHDKKSSKDELNDLFSTIFWFVAIFGIVVLLLVFLTSFLWFEDFMSVPTYPFAYLGFIPVFFMQLNGLGIIYLKQSLNTLEVSLVEIGTTIANILITLPLLVVYDMGVYGRMLGGFFPPIIAFVFFSYFFLKSGLLKLTFNFALIKDCLKFSLPLIPAAASSWIAGLSDRLIITNYDSLSATGLYSLAFNVAFLLYAVQDAITQVTGPIMMSGFVQNKEETKQKIQIFAELIWALMLSACLGLSIFAKDILEIFVDESYIAAYTMIPIFAFVYVASAQYRMWTVSISYHKKTKFLMIASISMALTNLVLNLIFIPIYGAIAGAYTTLASSLIYTFLVIYYSLKLEKFSINYKYYFLLLFLFLAFLLISYTALFKINYSSNLIFRIFMFLVFLFVAFLMNRNNVRKIKMM